MIYVLILTHMPIKTHKFVWVCHIKKAKIDTNTSQHKFYSTVQIFRKSTVQASSVYYIVGQRKAANPQNEATAVNEFNILYWKKSVWKKC